MLRQTIRKGEKKRVTKHYLLLKLYITIIFWSFYKD